MTYKFLKFVDDAIMEFVLDILIASQNKTRVGQSGGCRVESRQHEERRLSKTNKKKRQKLVYNFSAYQLNEIVFIFTWATTISRISSGVHMGTVRPFSSLAMSEMASVATAMKSWYSLKQVAETQVKIVT